MSSSPRWVRTLIRTLLGRTDRRPIGRRPKGLQCESLDERCLPSTYIPMLPSTGTVQGQGLNAVVYTPELDPSFDQANLPEAKLVTIMNNSDNQIFPIIYGSNSTADKTGGTVTRAIFDPAHLGEGYSGEYTVTFSLGSGASPVAATATAAGNGGLFSITLNSGGSGYQPGDVVTAVSITPIGNASIPTTPAVITAHASNITVADNGKVALYDPKDPIDNTYRGYIGEKNSEGQFQLGLQPGHQVTVQIPIAFWDGGRIYMVDNGPIPLSSQYDPGYPLQANAVWAYNPSLTPNALSGLGPGRSYIVAPTHLISQPIYGANFADPTTNYANPNGVVMWYHEVDSKPRIFGLSTPAVLTEATFRDPKQPFIAPNMRPDQIDLIDNYDVSYVDSLALPASMEATQVPSNPATPGSGQYAWTGSDLSTTQMQQAIAAFVSNNPSLNGLGTYFGGLGWDQFFLPGDNTTTAGAAITQVNNQDSNGQTPVTIITSSTAGLKDGSLVTIEGVTGQTAINGIWTISNLTPTSFALTGIVGNNVASTGGTWKATPTTGIHVKKIPAGYDAINQSALLNVPSQFDATKFNLLSGGTVLNVDTHSTGLATTGSSDITGVSTEWARQLVAGMLLKDSKPSLTPPPGMASLFPLDAVIFSIQIGTDGQHDSTITMSKKATNSGSPGMGTAGGSFGFVGSQYTIPAGSIAANSDLITGYDSSLAQYLRPGMMVSGPGIQTAAGSTLPTYIKSISADFKTITLTQSGTPAGGTGDYVFTGSPHSYIVQTLINNWYAWADYYVAQLASGPAAAPTGNFAATTLNLQTTPADPHGRADYNSLILQITDANFDMNTLRVGNVVTSAGSALTPNATGSPTTPGYDPSLNYTIVNFDQKNRTVELSLPVAVTVATGDTFTFSAPQFIVRSTDAPAAAAVSINSINTASGQPFTINTSNTAGLANGMEVTISNVIDSATHLSAAANGRWVITNLVPGVSFQLQGSTGNGQTFTGGIWSTTSGTIPYKLDFTVPNTAITSISNANGQAITITTGDTADLRNGQQITISGVTGQTGINGTWTIGNLTATTFELVGITGYTWEHGGPKGDGTPSSGGTWSPADALQFAQTVYDTMQTMSLLVNPTTVASRSASLLAYVIGGNTGSFVINEEFFSQTGRHTLLPNERTARQLRDQIKSLLRGVYSFNAIPDQSEWYPNPATPTEGATLNGAAVTFGIYNLDPYVWFVHDVLHNSSYGFSFDDDVANAQAASSTLQIAVGGNAYTAPTPSAPYNYLPNREAFAPWAQWGTQHSEGFIDTTSPAAIENANNGQITISGLSQAAVARLTASDPKKDHPGAYIITQGNGVLPTVVPTIVNIRASATVTQAITSISNPGGTTVRINTANTSSLGLGDLVTISGVTGNAGINGRWLVTNVVKDTSFDLQVAAFNGPYTGGTWSWEPSFVTFLKPANYTPPTDNAKHSFTFSAFLGTVVPESISSNVTQALPGAIVTVRGTGLTGVYGVSFNGYPAEIVGIPTDTSVQVKVPEIIPNSHGSTHPGPIGKIAVRNQSGTTYSDADFTILSTNAPPPVNEFAALGLGSSAVSYSVGPDDSLYRHTDATGWGLVAEDVRSLSATTDAAGNEVVFAIFDDATQSLRRWRPSVGWDVLGHWVTAVSAGRDSAGNPQAWVTGTDGALNVWRTSGGWTAKPLTGPRAVLSMSATDDNRCVVLLADLSVRVYTPTSSDLIATSGFARSVDAVSINGVLTVYSVTQTGEFFSYGFTQGWIKQGENVAEVDANSSGGVPMAYIITEADDPMRFDTVSGFTLIGGRGTILEFSDGSGGAVAALTNDYAINLYELPVWQPLTSSSWGDH